MANEPLSGLPQKTTIADTDLFLMSDVAGGTVDKAITGFNLKTAGAFFPASELEDANSVTPISRQYSWGNAFRYMTTAQITDVQNSAGLIDVTTPFNNAVLSGHGAFMTGGNAAISGTIAINGAQSLSLNNSCTLTRIGAATTPVVHLYGNAPVLSSPGYANIKNESNDHPDGIILVGPSPGGAGGATDIPTRGFTVRGMKVFGPVGTVENGSPGIYLHSGARRLGGNLSVCYKGDLINLEIRNCDHGLEFSSDANSHYVSGLYVTRWIDAAIWFNGSYGNVLDGVKLEFAAIDMVIDGNSNDKRYAIEFGAQNSGVETGTAVTYTFDAATDNSINGFAELTNGTGGNVNRNIALLNPTEPSGGLFGFNDVNIVGTLSGGIGNLGISTDAAVGTNNRIVTVNGVIDNRLIRRMHGHNIRATSDGTGTIRYKDSTCWLNDNHNSVTTTSTQGNLFSWDNIGGAGRAIVQIELSYTCKVDGTINTQSGTITWEARVSANTVYDGTKLIDLSAVLPEGGPRVFEVNLALVAGADNNTMKATVGFLSGGTGTLWAFGWDAKLTTNQIEGSTLDWADDISFTPTSPGTPISTLTSSANPIIETKTKLSDQTKTTDVTLADDTELKSFNLIANTEYIVEGIIDMETSATPDFLCKLDFSNATQAVHISIDYQGTTVLQNIDSATMAVFRGGTTSMPLTVHGTFLTNATTGGDVSFQWAQNVSDAANTKVLKGSWLRVRTYT